MIPRSFYFKKTLSKVKYGLTPRGAPKFGRLRLGLPAFPMPTPAHEEKPKKLIISYWNAGTLSSEDAHTLSKEIDRLKEKGFPIYQWHNNELTPLNNSDDFLTSIEDLKKDIKARLNDLTRKDFGSRRERLLYNHTILDWPLRPAVRQEKAAEKQGIEGGAVETAWIIASTEEALQAAIQQGIPRDELQILDDYWFKHLIQDEGTPSPRVLKTSEIPGLTSDSIDGAIKLLQSSTPKLKKIIFDNFTSYPDTTTALLIDRLLSDNSIAIEIPDTIKQISLKKATFSSEKLSRILKASKHVETLDLLGYTPENHEEPLALEVNNLETLQAIRLKGANLSLENLINILDAAPNLVTLEINDCWNLKGTMFIKEESIQNLVNVVVNSCAVNSTCPLSVENLRILASAPKLSRKSKKSIGYALCCAEEMLLRKPLTLAPTKSTPVNPTLLREPLTLAPTKSTPANPTHNLADMRNFKPTPDSFEFKFKGQNKTKNQGMIIEKLSQYLLINGKHLSLIPDIQDGICVPLSYYFLDVETSQWDDFLNKALLWDGHSAVDVALKAHFDALTQYIHKHDFTPVERVCLADNLDGLLESVETPMLLRNPWHAIAIKPAEEGLWRIYDPNYVTDYQTVEKKDLCVAVHRAIGRIVSVEAVHGALPPCRIASPDCFIEEGGLLALERSINVDELLSKLPSPAQYRYSEAALDGLFLRATSGRPTWLICSKSRREGVRAFASALLKQREQSNRANFAKEMTQSTEALTGFHQQEATTQIMQSDLGESTKQALIQPIQKATNKAAYEAVLSTWNKSSKLTIPKAYMQLCLTGEAKKRLIELNSTEAVDLLASQLKQACSAEQPVFYIDKPEDLICHAAYVKREEGNRGHLCKGPGGALYDFLQKNAGKRPVLLVNYEQFDADDIVRFNSLLDKLPNADGTPLPENTRVIGLMNRNKPDYYADSSFESRFHLTERCPLTTRQFSHLDTHRVIEVKDQPTADKSVINLYHASDWKERLLGRWVLNGKQFTYMEGALTQAIARGMSIEIQNGHWDDPDFKRFWQQALSGGVQHAGISIQIPEAIVIARPSVDGYDWEALKKQVTEINLELSTAQDAKTLNSGTLVQFIERYEARDNLLMHVPSFLELARSRSSAAVGSTCTINITRTLTDDELAQLLTEAANWGVTLSLHCAPGVILPEAFGMRPSEAPKGAPWQSSQKTPANWVIQSSDADTSIEMLTKASAVPTEVIDVSECTASDLLFRLDGRLLEDTDPPFFEFTQTDCALKLALAEGKRVILKGYFSENLLDELAAFILEREQTGAPGQLILVTPEGVNCTYIKAQYVHQVTARDKLACMSDERFEKGLIGLTPDMVKTEPLSQLKARCIFSLSGNTSDAWLGMRDFPAMLPLIGELNKEESLAESEAFTALRMLEVNAVLKNSPYVFLTGLSGVGKSTFVEQELCVKDALYMGEQHILDWINDTSQKRKILFLDEANLTSREWSEFEGLYNTPKTLLVNGRLHQLSDAHQVVFAGNPVNYGDERTLAPFFQRHGNAVAFSPLSTAVIYEKILKPIFSGNAAFDEISHPILQMYAFVCSCSKTEILISPRELEMIALLTRSRMEQSPGLDINQVAKHYIYQIAKPLVPPEKQDEFDAQFKPDDVLDFSVSQLETESTFLITESRLAVTQQLDDLLGLRESRRAEESKLNAKQKYGGLGGMILEGEPGIGKSELVIASLVARGYQEEHDFVNPSHRDNPFYRMPVSMGLDDKENLLIKAFNEGAVVMIDEINSSPMMERLLNDLLMGKNPRHATRAPDKPGFMIIGTQNPISMAGRRATSTALKRRLMTAELPEYKPKEISEILLQKGVPGEDAALMIDVYESKRTEAITGDLNPIPNFRHLMTLADNHMRALEAKQASEIPFDAVNKMKAFFEEMREGEARPDSGAAAKPGP